MSNRDFFTKYDVREAGSASYQMKGIIKNYNLKNGRILWLLPGQKGRKGLRKYIKR